MRMRRGEIESNLGALSNRHTVWRPQCARQPSDRQRALRQDVGTQWNGPTVLALEDSFGID